MEEMISAKCVHSFFPRLLGTLWNCRHFWNIIILEEVSVKPLIKDIPKRGQTSQQRTQVESTRVYTLYRKSPLKRGQPLYKGQNGWSRRCPFKEVPIIRGSHYKRVFTRFWEAAGQVERGLGRLCHISVCLGGT